jgi:hypothetical protein
MINYASFCMEMRPVLLEELQYFAAYVHRFFPRFCMITCAAQGAYQSLRDPEYVIQRFVNNIQYSCDRGKKAGRATCICPGKNDFSLTNTVGMVKINDVDFGGKPKELRVASALKQPVKHFSGADTGNSPQKFGGREIRVC